MSYRRVRVFSLAAAGLTIVAGLVLRRYGYSLGLTFPVVKYGGSLLWGSMVYFMAQAFMSRARFGTTFLAASIFAILVELFRLVHVDALDAFRMTPAGALLLGRVFSIWNILAYLAGIALAYAGSLKVAGQSYGEPISP